MRKLTENAQAYLDTYHIFISKSFRALLALVLFITIHKCILIAAAAFLL